MAITRIIGTETGDLSEWDSISGATRETTTVRTGDACVALTGSSTIEFDPAQRNDCTVAFYYRTSALPASNSTLFRFRNPGDTATMVSLTLNTDGTISLGGDANGTSTAALSIDTWYLIELQCDRGNRATLRIDETVEVNDTIVSNSGAFRICRWFHPGSSGTSYVDDVVYETTSSTYPGPGQIDRMRPDGVGSSADWEVTAGGSGNAVTDTTDGSSSTGIEETSTAGTHDFTLTTIASVGTINKTKSALIASRGNGGGTTHSAGSLDNDGTPTNVAALTLSTSDAYVESIETTPPADQTELDRWQFQVVKSGAQDTFVREIWLMVWHTPPAAATYQPSDHWHRVHAPITAQ